MPRKIDLDEIARTNPNIDLQKLDEWKELRRVLLESGLNSRRMRNRSAKQDRRAKIVDDADSDPRLVRLQK
jgi:hypothetical protein